MRVGLFSESFRPLVNGVSYSVQSYARRLVELGHDVHVFAAHYPGYVDPPDYPVHRYPGILTSIEQGYNVAVPFWPAMIGIMRKVRLDIIHTQSPFLLGVAGARWSRYLNIPFVTTCHTLYTEYVHYCPLPPKLSKQGVRTLTRLYCNRASEVIVPTEPIRDLLRGYGVIRPITVGATGIDREAVLAADPAGIREEHGISPEAELILFVGRLALEKNLPVLLDAFERIAERRTRAHLMIVGGGPEEERVQSWVAEKKLADRVTLAGWRSPVERNRRLKAADLFLYPSVTDTQGLVLCEALAAGLPCVAADAYGSKAVVRDGIDGLLTPPDPEAMADAVLGLLGSAERRKAMSRAAFEGSERFSKQAAVQRLLRVYERAIQNHPRDHSTLFQTLAHLR